MNDLQHNKNWYSGSQTSQRLLAYLGIGILGSLIGGVGVTLAATSAAAETLRLVAGATAVVTRVPRYVPPAARTAPIRTMGGGSRGCDQGSSADFCLLVPRDHVAQTSSGRPTFPWLVTTPSSVPFQFTLVEPGVSQPLHQQEVAADRVGLQHITLPATVTELKPEVNYRWTISQICNPNRPSSNPYATAWILRTEVTPVQQQAIAQAQTDGQKAEVYAAEGFWYDAVDALRLAQVQAPQDRATADAMQALLGQIQ
jgi:hypothetical protein